MRRKGEQPVVRQIEEWTPQHCVAHMIRTGSNWFSAWRVQNGYPFARLERASGVPYGRIADLDLGASITRAEVEIFARLWSISADDLIASMPDPMLLAD